ncbi:MAG TPA: hypothetical protein VKU86_07250 [Acidimicrobiales bacterium]|nr:hypothetical protein [Acidimicrobiales bacterium]
MSDAHRQRDRGALEPARQPVSVPPFERRRQCTSNGLSETQSDGEGVGHLARHPEVELGGLPPGREYGGDGAQAGETGQPRSRVVHHQPHDVEWIGQVSAHGVRPEVDLVAEEHGGVEGMTRASQESQC